MNKSDQTKLPDWIGWQKKLFQGKNCYLHDVELLSGFKQVNLYQFSNIHVSSDFLTLEYM